jgi:hypothetical protein
MRSKPWLLRRVCFAPDAGLQAMPRSCRTALSDRQLRARRCPWHAWLFSERFANLLKKSVAQPQTKGLRNSLLDGRLGRELARERNCDRTLAAGADRLEGSKTPLVDGVSSIVYCSLHPSRYGFGMGKPRWLIWRASRPQGISQVASNRALS